MPRLFDPVGDEDVGRAGPAVVAVGAEGDALAVWREHREAVKRVVETDLNGLHAVDVGHEDVEREGARLVVGAEQDVLAVWMEIGGPIGAAEVGDLAHVAAVGLGYEKLHRGGLDEPPPEEFHVILGFFALVGAAGTPHDVLTIGAEKSATVITELRGDALDVAAVDVAGVKVQVSVAGAGEDDFVAFRANGGFCIVPITADEQRRFSAFRGNGVDVIAGIDGPDIFVIGAPAGRLRAGGVRCVGGSIQDFLISRHEVGAGGAAEPGADWSGRRFGRGAIGQVHHVDLVAFHAPTGIGGLEDEAAPVKGPVGFGIVATVGQLANVVEVYLLFIGAVQTVRQIG